MDNIENVDSECKIWEGKLTNKGYPLARILKGGRPCWILERRRLMRAKEGEFVHDVCGNKACVNPDHLYKNNKVKSSKLNKVGVRERIMKWKEEGLSLSKMRERLREECGVNVHRSTIRLFLKEMVIKTKNVNKSSNMKSI